MPGGMAVALPTRLQSLTRQVSHGTTWIFSESALLRLARIVIRERGVRHIRNALVGQQLKSKEWELLRSLIDLYVCCVHAKKAGSTTPLNDGFRPGGPDACFFEVFVISLTRRLSEI